MNTRWYAAIVEVARLVRTCGMSLHYACRSAAWQYDVDADQLYRELTQ